jgi:hypothetical protein
MDHATAVCTGHEQPNISFMRGVIVLVPLTAATSHALLRNLLRLHSGESDSRVIRTEALVATPPRHPWLRRAWFNLQATAWQAAQAASPFHQSASRLARCSALTPRPTLAATITLAGTVATAASPCAQHQTPCQAMIPAGHHAEPCAFLHASALCI